MWARASVLTGDDPFLAQTFEVMLADAHLLDAAVRPRGFSAALALSLDLTLSWEPTGAKPGWLNMVAEAGAFVACTASIRAQDGALRQRQHSRTRLVPFRRPRPDG